MGCTDPVNKKYTKLARRKGLSCNVAVHACKAHSAVCYRGGFWAVLMQYIKSILLSLLT